MEYKTLTERCQRIDILVDGDAFRKDPTGAMCGINKRKLVNAIAEMLLANGAVMFKRQGVELGSDHYRFVVYARVFDKKPGLPDDWE